eukprot:3752567-Rhodomonas_salina.1
MPLGCTCSCLRFPPPARPAASSGLLVFHPPTPPAPDCNMPGLSPSCAPMRPSEMPKYGFCCGCRPAADER